MQGIRNTIFGGTENARLDRPDIFQDNTDFVDVSRTSNEQGVEKSVPFGGVKCKGEVMSQTCAETNRVDE